MEEDLLTKYLQDVLSRGSMPELHTMYEASLSLGSVGVTMREVIEKGVEELRRLLSYPEYLTSFRQVAEFWKGMEKLDRMVADNGLLLFTRSQRIPLDKSLFFQLLKHRKDIQGVRVVFDVKKCENQRRSSFCCIDEGDGIVTILFQRECVSHNKYDVSEARGRTVFRSDYSNTPSDINYFFDKNAEVPTILESNGYKIYISSIDEGRDPVRILEAIEEGRKGFVVFSGFQENGDYSFLEDGIQSYLPFVVCSLENGKANITSTAIEYVKNKYRSVTSFNYNFDFSCIVGSDLPEGLKLSYISLWIHKNTMPYLPYKFFSSQKFQRSHDLNQEHCCYSREGHSMFLFSFQKVKRETLTLSDREYKLGKEYKLREGYGYELVD